MMIQDYEKKVYTSILGKVIGVYLGCPFEGWSRKRIREKWGDTRFAVQFKIHSADRAGILVHYQGLSRWIGVIFSRQDLRIVRNYYGEETLAETDFVYRENELMSVEVRTCGSRIEVSLDGKNLLTARDELLQTGGAGIYIDHGCAGFGRFSAAAEISVF